MSNLSLNPPQALKSYYAALDQFAQLGITHETAVRAAFQTLREHCLRQCGWTLVSEHAAITRRAKRIVVDGALIDNFRLSHGYWEAKDIDDDLPAEVDRKFAADYPGDNILFQTPKRAILCQNGRMTLDADLADAAQLIDEFPADASGLTMTAPHVRCGQSGVRRGEELMGTKDSCIAKGLQVFRRGTPHPNSNAYSVSPAIGEG